MLPDSKIDLLESRLEQFKLSEKTRQSEIQHLTKEYGQLLDDYRAFKRFHEHRRLAPGAGSRTSQQKEQTPYVLLLVDGNEYIFNDELIRDREEGGMRAARLLNDAVEKQCQQAASMLRSPRIVIRIFADFVHLSKQLAQSKLVGFDKRSIAPFSAGFTRSFGFTEFVDTLDEEGTKLKIRENFRAAAEDSACSHIFFAACHDPAYLSSLVPHSGAQERVTLVQGANWKSEFHQFNLNVTQFPAVFRWSELPAVPSTGKPSAVVPTGSKGSSETPRVRQPNPRSTSHIDVRQFDNWRTNSATALIEVDDTSSRTPSMSGHGEDNRTNTSTPLDKSNKASTKASNSCKFYQKGFCTYGDKCKFDHAAEDLNQSPAPSVDSKDDRNGLADLLPLSTVPGYIPINKYNQRLDPFVRTPTGEEWKIYNERFHKQKPCNDFHLQGSCSTMSCPYDHSELEPEAFHVLKYVLKCNPCPRKSACRQADCYYGHICQKEGCTGNMKGCKMRYNMHRIDPVMVGTAPAEEELIRRMPSEPPAEPEMEMPMEENFLW